MRGGKTESLFDEQGLLGVQGVIAEREGHPKRNWGREPFQHVGPGGAASTGPWRVWTAVQPRKTPFHDPAVGAQSGAVPGAAACDRGHDAASADLVEVEVVVVAAVGVQRVGLAAGTAGPAADPWDRVEQQQLGDVVAVAAGQEDRPAGCRARR